MGAWISQREVQLRSARGRRGVAQRGCIGRLGDAEQADDETTWTRGERQLNGLNGFARGGGVEANAWNRAIAGVGRHSHRPRRTSAVGGRSDIQRAILVWLRKHVKSRVRGGKVNELLSWLVLKTGPT